MKTVNIQSKNTLARLMATENLVVEHKKVSTASFDVKARVLTLPIWNDMSSDVYEGLITHEVGHALYTPFEAWKDFIEKQPNLKDYANIIEDARIERKMKAKFPGVNRTMYNMYEYLTNKDFFGTKDREFDSFNFIDRINLHFKLGVAAQIPFSYTESKFVTRVSNTDTFEDVLALTLELSEFTGEDETETDSSQLTTEDNQDSADGVGSTTFDGGETEQNNSQDSDKQQKESKDDQEKESKDEQSDQKEDSCEYNTGSGKSSDDDCSHESETQQKFDESMSTLNDQNAKDPIYVDAPAIDLDNVVIGYKKTLFDLEEYFAANEDPAAIEYVADLIKDWKKDNAPVVNYMVKEFEMKQAASAHRRTATSKTGVLDTNKMHSYKINDDIFKSLTTTQDGKNHGLLMYIDWSGSMYNKIYDTVKQTLSLVMFARKVGIPFRVYAFTDGYSAMCQSGTESVYVKDKSKNEWRPSDRSNLLEFFNDNMNAGQFNAQIDNVMRLAWSIKSNRQIPDGYSLHATPLNEAAFAAYNQVPQFQRETGKEKINVIFLTDGESNSSDDYYDSDVDYTRSIRWNDALVIRDQKNRKIIYNGNKKASMTSQLMDSIKNTFNVSVIGFHITDRRDINWKIRMNTNSVSEAEAAKRSTTKNGYVGIACEGYSTYFLIDTKKLDKKAIDLEESVTTGNDGLINRGKLRTAFKKMSKGRKVNKMMLNEFVALVA